MLYFFSMYTGGTERPRRYSINTFNDKELLKRAIYSLGDEAVDLIQERSPKSSVPAFLGLLIDGVTSEVLSIPPRYRESVAQTQIGSVTHGDSRNLFTSNLEIAYRVFRHEWPTDLYALYALAHGTAIASVKFCKEFSSRVQQYNSGELEVMLIIASEKVRYKGGLCYIMERIAEGSATFPGNVIDYFVRWKYGYPTVSELASVREVVDRHFDNRMRLAGLIMEARRLQLPMLDFFFTTP